MADSKISALPSGAPAQGGDEYVVARSGANYKLSLTNIAADMPDTTIKGSLVVNENGADKDTRIEGDTDANLFFVDASTDRIGVGTATPAQKVDLASGNLIFSSTSQKILGKFDGSWSNRTVFQNYTTNAESRVGIIPNGTNSTASWSLSNSSSDPANSGSGSLRITNTALSVNSNSEGTGTPLPMHFNLYDAAESSGGTSTTRMVILNNGNVGIGTTSPNEKLSVAGTFLASTGASIGCNVNGTIPSSATLFGFSYQSNTSVENASFTLANWAHFAAYPGAIGASATVTNQFGVYIDSSLTGATNNYGLYSNIASGSNRWNFYANGTANNYFAGNVGIGTASPGAKLDVYNSAAAAANNEILRLRYTTSSTAGHSGDLNFTNASATNVGRISSVIESSQAVALSFWTFGPSAIAERMRIDGSGNVGIGTVSPGYRLDTQTATSITQARFSNSATGGATITSTGASQAIWAGGTEFNGTAFVARATTSSQIRTDSGLVTFFTNDSLTSGNTFTPTERMRIDSSGNVGIGGTADAYAKTQIRGTLPTSSNISIGYSNVGTIPSGSTGGAYYFHTAASTATASFTCPDLYHYFTYQGSFGAGSSVTRQYGYFVDSSLTGATNNYGFYSGIASGSNRWNFYAAGTAQNYFAGNSLFGTTSIAPGGDNVTGVAINTSGYVSASRDSAASAEFNRKTNDGDIVVFRQDGIQEGSISVAGNTVSYNPFMGSHYTEIVGVMPTLKGTVLESLDELVNGKYSNQDRLPKAKVSDTAGASAVYGVYFAPDSDPDTNDGVLAAALGASWVRIAAGVTVQRGDLLESNGDGCAKVQSDDVIRSKTIGKVTSTTVADTYADGSYIVPCVLYCG